MTRSRLRMGLFGVLLAALAGCGDDPTQPPPYVPPSSASSSPSASSAPSGPVEPTLPAAAKGSDERAAVAFVRHYFDMVNYAQATGDTSGLRALINPTCEGCRGGVEWIEKVYRRGGDIAGGEYSSVRSSSSQWTSGGLKFVEVKTVMDFTKQTVRGAGDLNETYAAGRQRWEFDVLHRDGGWRVERVGVRF